MSRPFEVKHLPGFGALAGLSLALLYAPLLVLVLFSFNDSRSTSVWTGFSFDWYRKAFENASVQQAAYNSFTIAIVATLAASAMALCAAFALRRRGGNQGVTFGTIFINLPLMVPEIITAVALLAFFHLLNVKWGIGNVIVAHSVFCIPFAFMPIRARMADMDRTLDDAAADLYANEWQTFRYVTLPLLLPGIFSGATLAFIISLDDFIITAMVAGAGSTTLPVYIYSTIRIGVTPETNAVSSLLLALSVSFVTLMYILSKKRAPRAP